MYEPTLLTEEEAKNAEQLNIGPPKHVVGSCLKCGRCCSWYECPYFCELTRQCKAYKNRPLGCRRWPTNSGHIHRVLCPGYRSF